MLSLKNNSILKVNNLNKEDKSLVDELLSYSYKLMLKSDYQLNGLYYRNDRRDAYKWICSCGASSSEGKQPLEDELSSYRKHCPVCNNNLMYQLNNNLEVNYFVVIPISDSEVIITKTHFNMFAKEEFDTSLNKKLIGVFVYNVEKQKYKIFTRGLKDGSRWVNTKNINNFFVSTNSAKNVEINFEDMLNVEKIKKYLSLDNIFKHDSGFDKKNSYIAISNVEAFVKYMIYYADYNSNPIDILFKSNKKNFALEVFDYFKYIGKESFDYYFKKIDVDFLLEKNLKNLSSIYKVPKNIIGVMDGWGSFSIDIMKEIYELSRDVTPEMVIYLNEAYKKCTNYISLHRYLDVIKKILSLDLNITNKQILKYMIEVDRFQAINMYDALRIWRCYLSNSITIFKIKNKLPINENLKKEYKQKLLKEIDKYPNSLKREYDLSLRDLELEKTKIDDSMLKDVAKQYSKFSEIENEKYIVKIPETKKELEIEGEVLNHCVGGYTPNITLNNSIVLFVRRKENPNKPFYTIEVKNRIITQVEGLKARRIDKKDKHLIDIYNQIAEMAKSI